MIRCTWCLKVPSVHKAPPGPTLRGIMAFSALMSTPSWMSGLTPSPRFAAAALAVSLFSRCFLERPLLAAGACVKDDSSS